MKKHIQTLELRPIQEERNVQILIEYKKEGEVTDRVRTQYEPNMDVEAVLEKIDEHHREYLRTKELTSALRDSNAESQDKEIVSSIGG